MVTLQNNETVAVAHLSSFVRKMADEGIHPFVIETFSAYYRQIVAGQKGLLYDHDLRAIENGEIANAESLGRFAEKGEKALPHTVRIVLNGGLGTSMGLTGPKSLLQVRNGMSFLELILRQTRNQGARLALMNSFSTHPDTLAKLAELNPLPFPLLFLQHKFPKILQSDLSPATCPGDPGLEWNPPGHGDIYTALYSSNMLERLLAEGVHYAFISNSDNLGATLDSAILGYFADKSFPFMMEVAQRTPSDIKGGHLARHKNGNLILREAAQCPQSEIRAFQDIDCYRFFNTNNIWVNLIFLNDLIQRQGPIPLPLILNPKTLDPRKPKSPKVFQVESAMGAAISVFKDATALEVNRSRFFPVKKCTDLLAVRSDYFVFCGDDQLILNPERASNQLKIWLDPEFFGLIDQFERRFAQGVPSLVGCETLRVEGDVRFEANVKIEGNVTIKNTEKKQASIPAGSRVDRTWTF
jgi:UTP--glucose-1-phosphate uridylyltransferase